MFLTFWGSFFPVYFEAKLVQSSSEHMMKFDVFVVSGLFLELDKTSISFLGVVFEHELRSFDY